MYKHLFHFLFFTLLSFTAIAQNSSDSYLEDLKEEWKNPIIGFIENKGQFANAKGEKLPNVFFKTHGETFSVYITDKGLTYAFKKESDPNRKKGTPHYYDWARTDLNLVNANINQKNILVSDPVGMGTVNYYLGHCPQGIFDVQTYHKITIKNVYPNIDWVLYANKQGLKYDFIVHPGGKVKNIKLNYEGAINKIETINDELHISHDLGTIKEGKLFCYQNENGRQKKITASYLLKNNKVEFQLSDFDAEQDLIIDPTLEWSTYYGGADGFDGTCSLDVDDNNNVIIMGYTVSDDLPVFNPGGGAYYDDVENNEDLFIVKFSNNGNRLWATYLGGSLRDRAWGGGQPFDGQLGCAVKADHLGNIYVASNTISTDFPTLNPGGGAYFQNALVTNEDAVLSKFSPTGVMLWSTYIGGTGGDAILDMTVDNANNLFVVGNTGSADFPTNNPGGGAYTQTLAGRVDLFLIKFTPAGVMEWSTFYGGDQNNWGLGITTDNSDNIYVTGSTSGTFPTMDQGGGAYYQANQVGPAWEHNAFLLKFNNNGQRLWATHYGGNVRTHGFSVACDNLGNTYMCGATTSDSLGIVNLPGAYNQASFGGDLLLGDGFIVKFDANGVRTWSTYFGGTGGEQFTDIVCDGDDNVHVIGKSFSADYPTFDPGSGSFFQGTYASVNDVIYTSFDVGGALLWSTYYGGTGNDWGLSIDVDDNDCIFGTGEWTQAAALTTKDPGNGAYYQATKASTYDDSFVNKFCFDLTKPNVSISSEDPKCKGDDNGTATAIVSGGTPGYTYSWSPGGSTDSSIIGLAPGTYTLTVTDNASQKVVRVVTINEADEVILANIPDETICPGDNVTLTASASGGTPGYTYTWDGGAGTGATYNVAPTDTSTYSVIAEDQNGCKDTAEVTVFTVSNLITDISNDTSICGGASVQLSASGGSTYAWTPTSSLDDPSSATPIASPTVSTTYTVIVSSGNCGSDTLEVSVTITTGVVAIVSPDTSVCAGGSVQLSAGGGTTYEWTPASSLDNANIAQPNASPTVPTTYTVIVRDGTCDADTQEVFVDIAQGVTAFVSGNAIICNGDSAQVIASGGSIYNWTPNTNITDASSSNPYVFPTATTTYSVEVKEGNCDPDTAEVTITVVPNITAGISNDTWICRGESIDLTATGGGSYLWSPANTLSDSATATVTATPINTTSYTVTVTSGTCAPATNSVTITVIPPPTANAGDTITILSGESVQLNGTGGGYYAWSPATGLNDTTSFNPLATPEETTTYTLIVTDGNGCKDTATVTIMVEKECDAVNGDEDIFFIPSAFSPNGDGMNDEIIVRINGEEHCATLIKFIIYDRWGEKVFETNNRKDAWNGTHRKGLLNSAVFSYYLEGSLYNGEPIIQKGNITLVR